MDHSLLIALSAVILVGALATAIWFARSRGSVERMRAHGAKRGLPVLPATDEEAVARAQRRGAAVLIPVILTVIPTCVAVAILLDVDAPAATDLVLLVPVIIAMSIASALCSGSQRVFSPAAGAPRIARTERRRVRDLLGVGPTRVSQFAVVIATLMAALCLGIAIFRSAPATIIVVVLLTTGCAILITVLRLAERSVLARPQPISSMGQLAWDDAMRADAVSLARTAMTQLAIVITLGAPAAVVASGDERATDSLASLLLSLTFAAVLLAQAYFTWRNDTYRQSPPLIAGDSAEPVRHTRWETA